jgi:50S ribosomal subunit-associated GTPase HflX
VTIGETFKRVQKWMEELRIYNKDTVVAVAGNKIDMNKIDISNDVVEEFVKENNSKHFYTSAKTAEGLSELFAYITKELSKKSGKDSGKNKQRINVTRASITNNSENSSKCC